MNRLLKTIRYWGALMAANLKSNGAERKRLFIMSLFMMIQNSMFFVLWMIFFQHVSQLRGWYLEDVARMYGIAGTSIGLSMFLFNGVRTIAYRIHDGSLDSFITRPKAALPMILMSQSSPSSLGDILYGPLVLIFLGHLSWGDVPLLFVVTLLSAIIFTSAMLMIYSIAFWLKGNPRFSDQLLEVLIIASATVQHGQPFFVRLIIMTMIPAFFITYLPTQLVRHLDLGGLMALGAATLLYAGAAVVIFNAGIKRYVNSLA